MKKGPERTKLTKRVVEDAALADAAPCEVMDTELAGFGLRVYAPSRARPLGRRSYFVRLRPKGSGQERRVILGEAGFLTVDDARQQAHALIAEAKQGRFSEPAPPPADELTVAQLADLYWRDHLAHHATESTKRTSRSLLEVHLKPRLGTHSVETIDRQAVARAHADLGTMSKTQANRMVTILSAILMWGKAHGHRKNGENPCAFDKHGVIGIKRFREAYRERFLDADEVARLEAAISHCQSIPVGSKDHVKIDTCEMIRAFLYTGARFGELQRLTWSMVDLRNRFIRILETKEGRPKEIPLNSAAFEVFARHAALYGVQPSRPDGAKPGDPVFKTYSPKRPWMYIIRPLAGLGEADGQKAFRMHDFRHTMVSAAINSGVSLRMAGKMVGHSQEATTERYSHFADRALHEAMERAGQHLIGEKSDD